MTDRADIQAELRTNIAAAIEQANRVPALEKEIAELRLALALEREAGAKIADTLGTVSVKINGKLLPGSTTGDPAVVQTVTAQAIAAAIRARPDPYPEAQKVMEDAELYGWLNKQDNFLIDIECSDGTRRYRLKCGEPLSAWIRSEINAARQGKDHK